MNIFLDDIRPCPDCFELCRSYEEFTRMVMEHKEHIKVISLDYDLGSVRTGLDACKFLCANQIKCSKIIIHSTHSRAYAMEYYLKEMMKDTEIVLLHG